MALNAARVNAAHLPVSLSPTAALDVHGCYTLRCRTTHQVLCMVRSLNMKKMKRHMGHDKGRKFRDEGGQSVTQGDVCMLQTGQQGTCPMWS